MKNNLFEYIILYVIVACIALVLATVARISAVSLGVDGFTAFIVFIIALAVQVVVYLSIHVVLQNLMLPWIERLRLKIPYFKNKKINNLPTDEITGSILEPQVSLSLDDIRNERLQNKVKDWEEKLNVALDYTRKSFAPYASDEKIELLCKNMKIYADKLSLENLQPVKVKELTAIDLRHFGWNIWNFFKPRNQMDVAHFLKIAFQDIFKDMEVETIKRHLKDDELKEIIKIQENLNQVGI